MTIRKSVKIPRSDMVGVPVWKPPRTRASGPLSPHVDRRSICPPIVDQGSAGLCGTNGVLGGHIQIARTILGAPNIGPLSRIYGEYFGSLMDAQRRPDRAMQEGVAVRSLIDAARSFGMISESKVPYNLKNEFKPPSPELNREAFHHQIAAYASVMQTQLTIPDPAHPEDPTKTIQVYDVEAMRQCIEHGTTFVFTIIYWDKMNTDDLGIITPPLPGLPINAGMDSHVLCAVGFDIETDLWLVRNSWNDRWNTKIHPKFGRLEGHALLRGSDIRDPNKCYDGLTVTQFLEIDPDPTKAKTTLYGVA